MDTVALKFTAYLLRIGGGSRTISNAGVYLAEPVFSHDQLYVALSKATARSNINILAPSDKKDKKKKTKLNGTCTKNIVYKEVLA